MAIHFVNITIYVPEFYMTDKVYVFHHKFREAAYFRNNQM